MKKALKNRGGFTLIELIVVVVVVAILSAGAVTGIRGIQRNARRTSLHADASALVGALNSFNAQSLPGNRITATENIPGDGTASAVLTVPPRGVLSEIEFPVHFEDVARRTQVIGVITFTSGHWRVDTALVNAAIP